MARRIKTLQVEEGYSHREHRSKKGRVTFYAKKKFILDKKNKNYYKRIRKQKKSQKLY